MASAQYQWNLALSLDEVLETHAEQPALRYADVDYTYSQLGKWVDSLATFLMSKNLNRGDVIAIGHDKHPLSYALMLAAIRLGIAYVNIDVASPIERSSRIMDVSEPAILFYDNSSYGGHMTELAATQDCEVVLLDNSLLPVEGKNDRESQLRRSQAIDGETIAYIMFTSGSTGVPKGVAVTHQNLLHFISWGRNRFNITNRDNFANLSPMYFDNSVFDFFVGLFSGASLSPIQRELLSKPYELVEYVDARACTVWFSVPSALMYLMTMKAFGTGLLTNLRTIIFGGEGYPKAELKKLYEHFAPQATLINVYGPTECTCICSSHTLEPEDFENLVGLPTLGQLNPNFDYRILDNNDLDAPEGELCLIGPNVAAGYFNDPKRTSTVFQTITDANRFMKRMYRTGDIVREMDGRLDFIGRKDNQIKHMGYRIELEEIEQALVRLAPVDQAVVMYHRAQATHGKLIAYVACSSEVDEKKVLDDLGNFIPHYMVPAGVVVMPQLPKNANGKIDRHYFRSLTPQ